MNGSEVEWEERRQLKRARRGDTAAFARLYRAHVGRVYALCLRLTADSTLAEDCTQRAFIRAWTRLAEFRGDSRLATWLHRIAVNEVMGSHREAGRRRLHEVPATDDDPEPALPGGDGGLSLDLERAIARLPERARHVFVLIAIHGHSHEEAGALLGIAAGTSKAQYHRARQLLCGWLELEDAGGRTDVGT